MLKLRVYQEEGVWCVETLDGSVVGCGKTLKEAFTDFGENFEVAIEEYVSEEIENLHISGFALRCMIMDWLR
ncbi:hypothetical protein [Pyrococcus kukulkanii]|uniref:hypothetical protein n=1 Tax=Pyrococcus kukulkanii TaxID=1609559 RepID=UPI003568AEE3